MNYSKLREAIKSSRIQRKDIALGANVTPKTIDNIIAGGDPKVSTLEAIAKVIGIKMSVLFDEGSIEIRDVERSFNPGQNDTETIQKLTDIIENQRKRIDELTDKLLQLSKE